MASTNGEPQKKINIFLICLIVAATGIAFIPSLSNGFISWDDPLYVTENNVIKGFSGRNIKAMFTSNFANCYCPLVILSHALEYRFFKLDPFIYHLVNYLLHIITAVLVFWFVYLLTKRPAASFIAALLFGVHPLHVESVAWIAERKDVLCAVFYLLSLIAYCKYTAAGSKKYYASCLFFTVLALLSKPMAVTVPAALILLDIYFRRRVSPKALLEKVPFFTLAFLSGLANIYFQKTAITKFLPTSAWHRLYFLLKAIPFYLWKVFAPADLSAMYSYHKVTPAHLAQIKYYIAILIVLAVFMIMARRRSGVIFFGSAFFLVTIAPVLQIIPTGGAFAADRYMYLPSIGVFLIIAAAFDRMYCSAMAKKRYAAYALALVFIFIAFALSASTWNRCRVWGGNLTFYQDALKQAEENPVIHNNLGRTYYYMGDHEKAIALFRKAAELNPSYANAFLNLGNVYNNLGRKEDAIGAYKKAIEADPGFADAYNNMGSTYQAIGRNEEALAMYREAIKADPDSPRAYNNLGLLYHNRGKYKEAMHLYNKAIEKDPYFLDAYNNLGSLYGMMGNNEKALALFKKVIGIDPDYADAYSNLALTYYKEKRYNLAIENCDRASGLGKEVSPALLEALKPYRRGEHEKR
ncbi:tetratricopeptide repeat protein [Candidatus Omnitrophota bacterium]